jgi:hypothetical protein
VPSYALHRADIRGSAIRFVRFLTLVQDGGGSSSYLLFCEENPVRFGDWMGPRADVEVGERRNISCPGGNSHAILCPITHSLRKIPIDRSWHHILLLLLLLLLYLWFYSPNRVGRLVF